MKLLTTRWMHININFDTNVVINMNNNNKSIMLVFLQSCIALSSPH